jgi:hypothetical protein
MATIESSMTPIEPSITLHETLAITTDGNHAAVSSSSGIIHFIDHRSGQGRRSRVPIAIPTIRA